MYMDEVLDSMRRALSERYRIDGEIGRGGMAVVYHADEPRRHREVAIKVLDSNVRSVLGRKRFLREVSVLSGLSHPNIVPILSAGQAEGFLYYVMPFIDGETVFHRIRSDGRLPVPEAVLVARGVASALAYAHDRGVVHRDIKPENILLSEGHAVVADFGIARMLSDVGGDTLTQTGLIVGSPRYMSPEQSTGQRQIDGRADIYALGRVLHEMVTGRLPDDDAVEGGMLDVPKECAKALAGALVGDRERRFRSAAEFTAALD
jgi:serine/threonine protein kinase